MNKSVCLVLFFRMETECWVTYSSSGEVITNDLTSFLNWNMPYGAMGLWSSKDHPSPFGPSASTPSDVDMLSPPANAPSPHNAPSPLSMALKKKTATDRAYLFAQGRFDDLVRSMNNAERR